MNRIREIIPDSFDHWGTTSRETLLLQPYVLERAELEAFCKPLRAVAVVVPHSGPWNHGSAHFVEIREAGESETPGVMELKTLPPKPKNKAKAPSKAKATTKAGSKSKANPKDKKPKSKVKSAAR